MTVPSSPQDDYGRTVEAACFSATGMRDHPASLATPPPDEQAAPPHIPGDSSSTRLDGSAANRARYAVEELIGMGATGEVYAVRDGDLERVIALKVLRSDLVAQRHELQSFLTEARTTARLTHPNVLPVLDFNLASDGRPYFTMHRIRGRTLMQMLDIRQPGPLAAAQINRLTSIHIAVCHAVSYAHAQSIIHQDIKPDNILLGDFGEVQVLDWGSAGNLDHQARVAGPLYGTPLYMSPEQARRDYADQRSDVYAIGATLFHAVLGRVPLWHDDPERFWIAKCRGDIDQPTVLERSLAPTELIDIAVKALAADPQRRYASVADMQRDLEHFQAGQAVSAHRYSLLEFCRRWYQSHRTVVLSGLVSVAAVTIALLLGWHQRQLERRSWHLVQQCHFPSLEVARHDWTGYRRTGWAEPELTRTPLAAPDFTVHDGWLRLGSHEAIVDATYEPGIMGNVRIEWDGRDLGKAGNLNCYIGAKDRESGFTMHVGGFGRSDLVVLTAGKAMRQLESSILPRPIVVGQVYHLALERADRHIRLSIDGRPVIDYLDVENIAGEGSQGFGFDTYIDYQIEIGNVSIFHQPLAQRVSPLEVADRLYQLKLWTEAEHQYREIALTYPGTDLAVAADFRTALCLRAQGLSSASDHLLGEVIDQHPGHELVPYALSTQLDLALAAGDQPRIEALRQRLGDYPGHPLLLGVLWQIGKDDEQQLERFGWPNTDLDGEIAVILDRSRHFAAWCERYRLHPADNVFWAIATSHLVHLGRSDLARKIVPESENELVTIDVAEGRFSEVLREDPGNVEVMIRSGRLTEVLTNAADPLGDRATAACLLGDFARLRALDPTSSLLDVPLLMAGRYDDYLTRHPADTSEVEFGFTTRVSVLLHLGRAQQVLAEYHHASARASALLRLGRDDEAMQIAAYDCRVCNLCAIQELTRGDSARAIHMADSHLHYTLDYDSNGLSSTVAIPALVHLVAGDHQRARTLLERGLEHHFCNQQQVWYLVSYALGLIDEATFRAQPQRVHLEHRLLLAKAIRCELANDLPGALQCYQAIIRLPLWDRQPDESWSAWTTYRLAQAGLSVPETWDITLIDHTYFW